MRYQIDEETPDARVATLAGRQWGVVSTAQLLAAGLTKPGITRRIRAGRLHPIHRGVHAVGHRALSPEGWWMAGVLAAGRDAALGHVSAVGLWGMLPVGDIRVVHVVTARGGGRTRRRGLRVHRTTTLRAEDVVVHRGIPTTTPARTLRDLRGRVPAWMFHRAVNQAEVSGLLSRAVLEKLFPAVADGTRSGLELRFLNLCRRHGVKPLPQLNVVVGGRLVDAYFPGERLVIELDSERYHHTRTGFHRDRRRGNDLTLAGFPLLRFTDRQLAFEPREVMATVKRARKAAGFVE